MKKPNPQKPKFWPELKEEIDHMLHQDELVKAGKIFGYPVKKIASCHFNKGISLKFPESSPRSNGTVHWIVEFPYISYTFSLTPEEPKI